MALDKQTRIGILAPITWSIPPKGYGPWERDVYDLVTGLVERGYKNVTLFATEETQLKGVKTEAIIEKPLSLIVSGDKRAMEMRHIEFAIKRSNQLDILNNHFNFLPLEMSSETSIPIVTTLHGAGIEPEAKKVFVKYKKLPYISLTAAERKFLPNLNYIDTVPNGIDFDEFRFHQTPDDYLVFVGRINPTKGVHHAIELAKLVNLPLYIAGPTEDVYKKYFEKEILPSVNDKNIFYLGAIDQTQVEQLVGQAKAFVALNEWEEPFGRSIAESMACGTPIIGTPKGSHNELIVPGSTGILVKDAEEAARRIGEIDQIHRSRCRSVAYEMFSLEVMISGYLRAFSKVISGHFASPTK